MTVYSQSIAGDGACILKGGLPMVPEQIVDELNDQSAALEMLSGNSYKNRMPSMVCVPLGIWLDAMTKVVVSEAGFDWAAEALVLHDKYYEQAQAPEVEIDALIYAGKVAAMRELLAAGGRRELVLDAMGVSDAS